MRTRAGTGITSKTDAIIDNGHALWSIPADAARQARHNRRAVSTALAPLNVHPRDNIVPEAATLLAHLRVPSNGPEPSLHARLP
jgi:hypothetical protein